MINPNRAFNMTSRMAALSIAALVLGACSTWLGSDEAPPLPGKRISVLLHETALSPDETEDGAEIRLPAPSPTPDWPQNGGYANHAMHHVQAAPQLKLAWTADIGSGASDGARFTTSPIIAEGRLYAVDTDSVVTAFDAKSGKRLWRTELTPDEEDDGHIQGGLAYEQGRVFAATGFAQVIALDASSGEEIWRKGISGPVRTAPTVRGGRVFAVSLDNQLHVLAANDGRTLWNHSGSLESTMLLGGASPAVDQGVVVTPYTSGEIAALRVENGRQLWIDSLTAARRTNASALISHIRANPIIDRGRVFAVSNSGLMISIDLRTGARIWEKNLGSQQPPWVAGDYIFALTDNQELAALERSSGRVLWVRPMPRYEDPEARTDPIIWTGPLLVSDRLVIASSSGQAVAISPYSGKILGSENLPDGISVPPVVAGDTVYFLADDATLVAFR